MSFSVLIYAAVAGFLLASPANAEEIHNFRMCRKTHCEVFDVFVDPCPEALDSQPCEVPQGQNASIQFKFKAHWGSIEPATRLYAETLVLDMPFMGMDTDACKYTNCPVVEQATQTWQYTLFILDSYPKGSYTVKMKLWDNTSGASSAHECCFKLDIKIV